MSLLTTTHWCCHCICCKTCRTEKQSRAPWIVHIPDQPAAPDLELMWSSSNHYWTLAALWKSESYSYLVPSDPYHNPAFPWVVSINHIFHAQPPFAFLVLWATCAKLWVRLCGIFWKTWTDISSSNIGHQWLTKERIPSSPAWWTSSLLGLLIEAWMRTHSWESGWFKGSCFTIKPTSSWKLCPYSSFYDLQAATRGEKPLSTITC